MKRKMTRLTRCGWSSVASRAVHRGVDTRGVASDWPTMPANAIIPKPLPTRRSASRRVIGLLDLCIGHTAPQLMNRNSLELNSTLA